MYLSNSWHILKNKKEYWPWSPESFVPDILKHDSEKN